MLNRLFDIFDRDGNGRVDTQEFLAGLSVLCGGDQDTKIQTAFSLYDYNNDGFISPDEMERYLASVFAVIQSNNPAVFAENGVTPDELAAVTAEQCFEEADTDRDGRLSFDEFKVWYQSPSSASINGMVSSNAPAISNEDRAVDRAVAGHDDDASFASLQEARSLTGLGDMPADEAFAIFAEKANARGELDRSAFRRAFKRIMRRSGRPAPDGRLRIVLDRLFDVFDADSNGTVDQAELTSGLTVLCQGDREDKVAAAFARFDINGDGHITIEEMTSYLTSVFRVLYHSNAQAQDNVGGVSPEDLGRITAEQCFEEADLNHDGRISFDEFQKWYVAPTSIGGSAVTETDLAPPAAREGAVAPASPQDWTSFGEVRRLTGLGRARPAEAFQIFAKHADEDGLLDRPAFTRASRELVANSGDVDGPAEMRASRALGTKLFDIFDEDGNGVVDFTELASGLSVLCGGDSNDKVAAAFSLFDLNGDGFIDLEEMTRYMKSVFRVLYSAIPTTGDRMGCNPDELGELTARQAFEEADLNHDGRISFDEFGKWYKNSGTGNMVGEVVDEAPSWMSLAEARRLTSFAAYSAEELFVKFADMADEEGLIDRRAFNKCCVSLLKQSSLHAVIRQPAKVGESQHSSCHFLWMGIWYSTVED